MDPRREFEGVNAGYVAELYDRYQRDPSSVDEGTRAAFARWTPPADATPVRAAGSPAVSLHAIVGAANLAESIRRYGHLAAHLDPLGSTPIGDPSLEPAAHGVTDADLKQLPASMVGGPVAASASNAYEAIEKLRTVYESTTGYDYSHVFVPEEREWLRYAAEACKFRPPIDPLDEAELLDRLTQVDVFERFLHRTFPGKTRFSIEGLDMLVPVLDEIVADAAGSGIRHILFGMAHRGRLNVLAHVLQKPYAEILAEFKDPLFARTWRIDVGYTGDVKYHAGARTDYSGSAPGQVIVSMAPNPSHLEAVNPVVAGMARAAGTTTEGRGDARFDPAITLPVLIHGDAAFPGQGIVAETLNLSRLAGYDTGGTIHVIANNQLGFTATPPESYSTSYASGLARGFKIPIVHVNADDPVACIEAARLAWAYRTRFGLDFLIDLIGYRRHGHNEGDEPAFTQPLIYAAVHRHPTVREIWAKHLVDHSQDAIDALVKKHTDVLEHALQALEPEHDVPRPAASPALGTVAGLPNTGIGLDRLRALNEGLLRYPDGFTIHRKLERARERRRTMLRDENERTVDWASAEELAFASILEDGVPIRLTGEDVERGTFSHRHAVLHDAVTGARHVPLQALSPATASFELHNSPLTENATVGFEFGYNVQAPGQLVIWEAQYGDFINGAQVMLDEFVTSGRAKWGQRPSLVFLLPHGLEGQGPDHSSARPERFLQSAADTNLRLCNCTTAAQYFHLLRRQAATLRTDPLPLFVLTPKSLLRHPMTASAPRELAEGRFLSVIDDEQAQRARGGVRRLILCSGKVYVDLVGSEQRAANPEVAICRVEQLYPFPHTALRSVLDGYPGLREVMWLQEEPENIGAWEFVRPRLEEVIGQRWPLRYVGRARSASPSEGSAAWHQVNQRMLIDQAYDPHQDVREMALVSSKLVGPSH